MFEHAALQVAEKVADHVSEPAAHALKRYVAPGLQKRQHAATTAAIVVAYVIFGVAATAFASALMHEQRKN